ncbi:hypothetical protein PQ459_05325 [Chryseobacterium sp. KACC 21268]|nr:hypothetical protein PQ459_05325 [Chryseobacterium sp. KACC 21268]
MNLKFLQENGILYFFFCLAAVFFLFNPAKFPSDDGFFYPQIAFNIVHGKGSYFNDLYLTNGYHPLWMICCILAESLNPFSKQDVVYILWAIQVIYVLLSFRKLEIFFKDNLLGKIFSYFCISILFFSFGTLYLIEAHLNLFCFCLILWFLAKQKNNDWLFGVLFSLVFLSRLDNVFLLAPLGIYYLIYRKWDYKVILKSGIVILLICGAYLLSNFYWFGSLVPISGRIKSSFPNFQPHIFLSIISKFFLGINLISVLILILFKKVDFRSLKLFFAIGSLIQILYNIGFQSQIGQWYYVAQTLVLIFLVGDLISFLIKNRNSNYLVYPALILGILISCGIGYFKMSSNFSLQFTLMDENSEISDRNQDEVKVFAENIKKTLPENSRIFTYDFPGKFAFYSDMNIIPADGLVGNKMFFDDISTLKFNQFLRKNNINYVNLPSAFIKDDDYSFIGIFVKVRNGKPTYFIKNSMTKEKVDSLDLNNYKIIETYKNPIKTWQKEYDSITIYQLKY